MNDAPRTLFDPSTVVAEVSAAAHDYEDALVAGDVRRATAWFGVDFDQTGEARDRQDGVVTRFGPGGEQRGATEVAGARAAQAAVDAPIWISDDVEPLSPDIALHLAVVRRGDQIVQRTQVWVLGETGWRIRHAHVSRRAKNQS